jgi:hypothetical protein
MPREPVNVAASIIADVSAGIYRSPAGALKELVSNAFDADATVVHLSSGAPGFRVFTCTDNGKGMTPDEFRRVMKFIGGSTKRDGGQSSAKGRPFVGRIGIGLLAVAQLSRRFRVISSAAGRPTKFEAVIDLEPYLLAEARRMKLGQKLETEDGEIRIGTYELTETSEESGAHYTRIVMEKIEPGFRQKLRDAPAKEGGLQVKEFKEGSIIDFIQVVQRGTVAERGAYAQMVWELATTAPVKYLDNGPIKGSDVATSLKERLVHYDFTVFLDGVELRKPILLPPRRVQHRIYPLALERQLPDGRRLSASGYLYWQKAAVRPRELQGILVRVRDVAVISYDPTYLGYPHHEGWKFSQMTGELFVDEGLDQAVNIDRSSFRETDDAYVAIQGFLWERLKKGTEEATGIFSAIKKETSAISQRKRADQNRRRTKAVRHFTGARLRTLDIRVADGLPTGVSVGNAITVERELAQRVGKRNQVLFASVCALLERHLSRSVSGAGRREIYERLAGLFGEF